MNDTTRICRIKAVARIASMSSPRTRYTVKLSPRTLRALECTCKAYEFSKEIPHRCKHLDEADALIAALGLEVVL